MLESAKENLVKMRWFGLIEYQLASKELFEYSFQPLRFDIEFEKWDDTHSSAAIQDIPQKLIDEITRLNHLDAELYAFARELPIGFRHFLIVTVKMFPARIFNMSKNPPKVLPALSKDERNAQRFFKQVQTGRN